MKDKKVCCEDENVHSIECAPKKKKEDNETDKKNKCGCRGCC